jgi:hypothetical protein
MFHRLESTLYRPYDYALGHKIQQKFEAYAQTSLDKQARGSRAQFVITFLLEKHQQRVCTSELVKTTLQWLLQQRETSLFTVFKNNLVSALRAVREESNAYQVKALEELIERVLLDNPEFGAKTNVLVISRPTYQPEAA